MTDDEIVKKFQDDVLGVVNSCRLPISVKAIVLENILLKANEAMRQQINMAKNNSQCESSEVSEQNG